MKSLFNFDYDTYLVSDSIKEKICDWYFSILFKFLFCVWLVFSLILLNIFIEEKKFQYKDNFLLFLSIEIISFAILIALAQIISSDFLIKRKIWVKKYLHNMVYPPVKSVLKEEDLKEHYKLLKIFQNL